MHVTPVTNDLFPVRGRNFRESGFLAKGKAEIKHESPGRVHGPYVIFGYLPESSSYKISGAGGATVAWLASSGTVKVPEKRRIVLEYRVRTFPR
jgi:hypothetical protein